MKYGIDSPCLLQRLASMSTVANLWKDKDRKVREGWKHRQREVFPLFHPILSEKKNCRQDTNGSSKTEIEKR